jgi:hypothetical protein
MKLEEWQKTNKFIPLTYLEAKLDKPLVIKLNDEFNFVCFPQSALTFATVIDAKDNVLKNILYWAEKPDSEKDKRENLLKAIRILVEILFELSCKEYIDDEKKLLEYRKVLFEYGLNHIDELIEIWGRLLEHNTRIEKKNALPDELQCDTNGGQVDKWRGFLHGRRNLRTKRFIELIHEDEQLTVNRIVEWKESKRRERKNKMLR